MPHLTEHFAVIHQYDEIADELKELGEAYAKARLRLGLRDGSGQIITPTANELHKDIIDRVEKAVLGEDGHSGEFHFSAYSLQNPKSYLSVLNKAKEDAEVRGDEEGKASRIQQAEQIARGAALYQAIIAYGEYRMGIGERTTEKSGYVSRL